MKSHSFTEDDLMRIAGLDVAEEVALTESEELEDELDIAEDDIEDVDVEDVDGEEDDVEEDDDEIEELDEEGAIELVRAMGDRWDDLEDSFKMDSLSAYFDNVGDGHLVQLVDGLYKSMQKTEDALNLLIDAIDGEGPGEDETTESPEQDELDKEAEAE